MQLIVKSQSSNVLQAPLHAYITNASVISKESTKLNANNSDIWIHLLQGHSALNLFVNNKKLFNVNPSNNAGWIF